MDPGQLRTDSAGFDQVGAQVAAAVQYLSSILGGDSAPWGDDAAGRSFGDAFAPEEKQTVSDLDSLVKLLRQAGPDLRQLVNNVETQDIVMAQSIRNESAGFQPQSTVDLLGGPYRPGPNATDVSAATKPFAGSITGPPVTAATAAPRTPATAGAPSRSGAPPTGQQPSGRPGGDTPGRNGSGARSGPHATDAPGVQAGGAPGSYAAGNDAVRARSSMPWPGASATGAPVAAPATSTPWSTRASSKPPKVTPPGFGAQPRPPVGAGTRPPASAGKQDRESERSSPKGSRESLAARLTRHLAERHGVRAFGFDTPDVPDQVLTEIVAAVDKVLPWYPSIVLSAIGIAELPAGESTRLERDSTPERELPREIPMDTDGFAVHAGARIVLAAGAATDPDALAADTAASERAGLLAPGCARRPVFSSIVRELGGALDMAGGFTARALARHALIAGSVPPGPCPDRTAGRLEPAAALAEAFTDVVLNAGRVDPPARQLHQLLVDAAASPTRDGRATPG